MALHIKSCRNKKYELPCTQDVGEMEAAAEARPLPAGEGQGRQMCGKAKTTHEGAGDGQAVADDAREEASERDRVRRLQERKQRAMVTEQAQALREEADATARLGDMGFDDVGRIRELLRTCNGDIAQVIPLLAESAGHTPENSQAACAPSTARDDSGRRGERKSEGGEASDGEARGQGGQARGGASGQASARQAGTSCTLSHWDTSEQLPVVFDYTVKTKPRSPEPQHTKALKGNMKDTLDPICALQDPISICALQGDSAEECHHQSMNTARDGQSFNVKRPRRAPRDECVERSRDQCVERSGGQHSGAHRPGGEAHHATTGQRATTECKLVESRHRANVERRQQQGREVEARDAKVARKERQAQASTAQANKTQGHAWLLVHGVFLCRMHVLPISMHVLPISKREPAYHEGPGAPTGSRDMNQWQDSACVTGEWEITLTSHVAEAQLCLPQVLSPF
jgi:hypothetical protein